MPVSAGDLALLGGELCLDFVNTPLNGDTAAADEALREACDICRAVRHPATYLSVAHYLAQLRIYQVRAFLDARPGVDILLRRALDRALAPGYVARLLEASGQPPLPLSPGAQPLIEPLTPRELEVLGLIASGLRNQEIADELVISLVTVKRHISNIHGKLGVSHRTQAVAHAQELCLLPKRP